MEPPTTLNHILFNRGICKPWVIMEPPTMGAEFYLQGKHNLELYLSDAVTPVHNYSVT